jgi:UDP-N-acetyl-D-mannosaminuronic acid dehydrogenase
MQVTVCNGSVGMKICVIGLGEVGFATAKYILDRRLDLWGYDISSAAIERAKKAGVARATQSWEIVPSTDVYLICVYAGLKGGIPDSSAIFDACEKIKSKTGSSDKPLVSIESTIVPGLCKSVFRDIFEGCARLVHVPHRYWAEEPVKHGVKQSRVIGGVDAESLKAGVEFYRDVLGISIHQVSSVEVAEMSKIAEQAYRYVQIAFAEELRIICEESGLRFDEVRRACNTKWNIEILEARDGIGGHCLPKDVRYLASLTSFNTLMKGALTVDEQYRKWLKHKR